MLQLRYNSEPFGNNIPIYLDDKETHTPTGPKPDLYPRGIHII